MSYWLTALSVFFVLFLRGQSFHLIHDRSFSSLPPFDFPEVDGSAVDPCNLFTDHTPDTTSATTTTTTTTPVTRKVVSTTKKPVVQSSPRKPETKKTGAPIRPQPAPSGPITNPTNSLLYYLLANSRRLSRPIGGHSASDSDESAAKPLRSVGRREERRWKIGSLSSEDSSDES